MAIKIRLARGGSKKRPFYRIVATDNRMPRDGRFIEKLGTYNPLLGKDDPDRVKLDLEKIKIWLGKGAQTSDRVSRMLESLSILPAKTRSNPKKGEKHKATLEREAAKAGGSIADDSPPDNKVSKESQENVSDDPGKSDQVKEEGNEKENLAQSADQEPSKADDISDKKQQADSNGVTTEDDKESK